jgi:hypothetical protein
MNTKIFGIGFHKTGTSTLAVALTKMGYSVCNHRLDLLPFEDNPWPLLYEILDHQYPGSKFILTFRDEKKWIKSIVNYFGKESTPMREWIYSVGSPQNQEKVYLDRYRQHNQEVIEYFKDRPQDLLVISWEKGHGWKELCEFLEQPLITQPFPHVNKSPQKTLLQRIKNSVKQKIKAILDVSH